MREHASMEIVDLPTLYQKILDRQRNGWRLVQICATATDTGAELIYSVAKEYAFENYKIIVPDTMEITSISDIFPSAALFENEITELFGVKIDSINMDFHGKFYRIDTETPFKKAKPVKEEAENA